MHTFWNRREFFYALAAGSSIALGQPTTPAPIKATKLSDTLSLVSGDGGNVAIVMSDDGLLMVDGGLSERSAELLKAVAEQVDPHRVRTVFNTHWHLDHVGCNEVLGKDGAKIIAHENVKKRLGTRITMEALNRTIEPLKPEGLPSETFTSGGKMTFGAEKIEYMRVPPAHTDGDSYLFFPVTQRVAHGRPAFQWHVPVHRLLHRRMDRRDGRGLRPAHESWGRKDAGDSGARAAGVERRFEGER